MAGNTDISVQNINLRITDEESKGKIYTRDKFLSRYKQLTSKSTSNPLYTESCLSFPGNANFRSTRISSLESSITKKCILCLIKEIATKTFSVHCAENHFNYSIFLESCVIGLGTVSTNMFRPSKISR